MSPATASISPSVTVSVPATTANLGPGFDCLGLALNLRNEMTFRSDNSDLAANRGQTEYCVTVVGVDADKVPADRNNLTIQAAEVIFERTGRRPASLDVRMINKIPVGSGLGSSSSAIVAGLVAGNTIVNGGLSADELLRIAVEMEGHPDNVAPAMLGGLVLGVLPDSASGPATLIVHRMEPPGLSVVTVLPDFQLLTSEARAVLPSRVTRQDAIFNASRLGLLLHALTSGEYHYLRVAMGDRLHQPRRLKIIPGASAAYQAGYEAGAIGVALSGAGPSLIAFANSGREAIASAMVDAFAACGLTTRVWMLEPSGQGVEISVSKS